MKKAIKILSIVILCTFFSLISLFNCVAIGNNDTAKISLNVKCELYGEAGHNEDECFRYTITSLGGAPLPKNNIIEITGTGERAFDSIEYTKVGVYDYLVTPTAGNNSHIQYDTTVYRVCVTVVNKDSNPDNGLVATVCVVENKTTGKKVDTGLIFKSTCNEEKKNPFDSPLTDEESNYITWIALMGISAAGLVTTITIGKKRENKDKD